MGHTGKSTDTRTVIEVPDIDLNSGAKVLIEFTLDRGAERRGK